MRFALPLLAALALLALVACGGEDEAETDTTEPAALEQRVLAEEDAPGSKPDPVEKRQTTADFDEFIEALGSLAVDPDTEEMTGVFEEAGFEGALPRRASSGTCTPGPRASRFRLGHSARVRRRGDERPRLARSRHPEAMPQDLRRPDQRVRGGWHSGCAGRPPKRER